ncbi:MAG TPA: DUF4249 family protein [Bacteroidetes bacterium]|nr:DUF4249 family protein [Bacteroidota bacterium]
MKLGSKMNIRHVLIRDSFPSCIFLAIAGLAFMFASTGCESTPAEAEKYDPQAVLYAYLTNGEPVGEVYLERIAPLFNRYDFEDAAITGAEIVIFDTDSGDTLHLTDDPQKHGRYIPVPGEELIPRGRRHYRIECSTPDGEFLWSETSVPDTFISLNILLIDQNGERPVSEGDTLTRNDPNMFWRWEIDTTGGFVGGYAGLIVAETPRDSLVPLDPDWDPNDPDDALEEEDRDAVGWTVFRYDAEWTTIAWAFFEWEGPTRIELQAVSVDYYNYLWSNFRVMQGMLERPVFNINGGLGIFAGLSKKVFHVYMKRVESEG